MVQSCAMRARQSSSSLILIAVVILLAGSLALAKTYLVDASNNSGNEDGTAAHPFRTITAAMNNAVSGDLVQVRPGTYKENIAVLDGVTLRSIGGASVTIVDGSDRSNTVQIFAGDPNTILDGFTITGGRGLSGGGVFVSGPATVSNNIISGNRAVGSLNLSAAGGGIAVSGNAKVQDNLIFGNTAQIGKGGGVAVTSGSPII